MSGWHRTAGRARRLVLQRSNGADLTIVGAMLLVALLSSCKRVERRTPQKVLDAIEQVRQQFCPDRRLEVFDIAVEVRGANLKLTGELTSQDARAALVTAVKSVARNFKVEDEVVVLPDPQLGGRRFGIVEVSVANLRAEPRHSAELVNQVLLGSTVALLKHWDGWFYCRVEDGYLGWLTAGSVLQADSLALAQWRGSDLAMFAGLDGQLLSEPEETSLPVSDLVLGAMLRRASMPRAGWGQVELPDRRLGYVPSRLLAHRSETVAAIGAGVRLVNTARRFLGVPYLWGGTTVNGFDCSGLAQTVFRQNGMQLLRDVSQQARGGRPVEIDESFANLRAGDLLFFGSSPEKTTHVAISMGSARFIHASDFVRINSLYPQHPDYDEQRARTLQLARRYLEEPWPISGRGKL